MTIKDIYHGNQVPIEVRFDKDSKYVGLSKEWLKLHDEFKAMLTDEQNKLFNKLCDIQGEQTTISDERSYKQGFRHEDFCEPIIDKNTWDKAQFLLGQRSEIKP